MLSQEGGLAPALWRIPIRFVARISGGKPAFPTPRLFTSLFAQCLKCFPSRFDCLVDDLFRVCSAHKRCFKLRWRKIDTLVKHGVEKSSIELSIALSSRTPVCNRLVRKEAGPHRADSIRKRLKAGFGRCHGESFA